DPGARSRRLRHRHRRRRRDFCQEADRRRQRRHASRAVEAPQRRRPRSRQGSHQGSFGAVSAPFSLRRYQPNDEDASVALWLRSWQAAYPALDFAARLDWWRERWRNELVSSTEIVIAETADVMIGFVTVDPKTLYLDQLVVAPESWGAGVGEALIVEAK